MKKQYIIAFSFLIVSTGAMSQKSGNSQYFDAPTQLPRTAAADATTPANGDVVLHVNGILNIVPDSYSAIFHIIQVGEKADETDALMRERIKAFTDAVTSLSGDSIVVRRDLLSFVPRYDFHWTNRKITRYFNEEPDGYEMQVNLHVSYKHTETLERIVTTAARHDIIDLASVNYFVHDQEKYREMLRDKCLKAMRGKFKTFAALGIRRDSLNASFADKFYTTYPDTRYDTYRALTRPSLTAARKSDSSSIGKGSGEVAKAPTHFYTPVNYDAYDVVIHPEVNEPVIQFSYSLEVRYAQAGKKNIVVLTPQGELKPVSLN